MAAAPFWVGALQYRLVMLADSLAHSLLAVFCLAELAGLDILHRGASSVLSRPLGSARRLLSLLYDSSSPFFFTSFILFHLLNEKEKDGKEMKRGSLGMLQLALTMPRFFFSFPNDDVMTIVQRIAILQCCLGAALHYSSVVRWKTRSCEYRVPPLLILMAYFLVPWTSMCCFLLLLRPGDHKLGTWHVDCMVLAASAALRVGLFGRYGRPRMPRAPQALHLRLADALVIATTMLALDLLLLRNAWIERRKNWRRVVWNLKD